MSENLTRTAQRYLTPSSPTFWHWSPDGAVIAWKSREIISEGEPFENTIVFREELLAILSPLASQGLPPLDLVLLVLAACRDVWEEHRLNLLQIFKEMKLARAGTQDAFATAVAALDRVAQCSAEQRRSVAFRKEIVAAVLERVSSRTSIPEADEVILQLQSGFPDEPDRDCPDVIKPLGQWTLELRGLCDGLAWFSEDEIQLRVGTGLEQLPTAIDSASIEETTAGSLTPRELLAELERDAEFRGLARLARNLMALVHLPRQVGDPDHLPLGGVSDLTNRGRLDQLLLSELANDADVLMTRVALREALYLRRETPPAPPPAERVLLLDSGLRMWGLPRVFAAGVALSIAATSHARTYVFRAANDTVVPVDLASKQGFIEHLAALDPRIHPGAALVAFRKEIQTLDAEIVLVTDTDVWTDPDFQRELREARLPDCFVAIVSRAGRLRLLSRSAQGERSIREGNVDLQLLFPESAPDAAEQLRDESAASDLPAMLHLRKFPLLLAHQLDPERTLRLSTHDSEHPRLLSMTSDGRLMSWRDRNRGAEQIADGMPTGNVLHVNEETDVVRMLVGSLNAGEVSLIWLDAEYWAVAVIPLEISQAPLRAVSIHAGSIFAIGQNAITVCHGTDGSWRSALQFEDREWISERFFRRRDGSIDALSPDASSARFETLLPATQTVPGRNVIFVTDGGGKGAPVVVFDDGTYQVPPEPGLHLPLPAGPRYELLLAARDGSSFVLGAGSPTQSWHVRFEPFLCRQVYGSPAAYVRETRFHDISHRQLRARFQGVNRTATELVLIAAGGKTLVLSLNSQADRLELRDAPEINRFAGPTHVFEKTKAHSMTSAVLQFTKWNDGSSACLDSRGLLHLRSSNPRLPEFTLILLPNRVSGWTSDGQVWGDPYFHPESESLVAASHIWKTILVPFLEHLQ